jgi:predicted adenylyl cyclase CyaB
MHVEFKDLYKNSCLIRNVTLERKYFSPEGITTLLYKKKEFNENDHIESEEKISCQIDNVAKAKRIFTSMGLKNWCTKKITGYIFKRNVMEMLVQEVEGFGLFIEIEQFRNKTDTYKKAMDKLIKFVNELNIPIKPDYHVNIAYEMYLRSQTTPRKTPAKAAARPVAKKPAATTKTKKS